MTDRADSDREQRPEPFGAAEPAADADERALLPDEATTHPNARRRSTLPPAREAADGPFKVRDPAATITLQSQPPEPITLETGERVGRYVIEGRLGSGGMGVVYRAYDPELERAVALKLLAFRSKDRAIERNRLMREGQALAQLSHPNIVTVYDVGAREEDVFIAMELVDGEPLSAWLADSKRSLEEVLKVFVAAGRGLEAAHRVGILHRDFKPHNVLVGKDGRVRVIDFGLARVSASVSAIQNPNESQESTESHASSLSTQGALHAPITEVGAVIGTPRYMSPEQWDGLEADELSDQFSFCVALYEAIAGQPPFKGPGASRRRRAIARQEIAEPRPGHRVPPWLRKILLRGMSESALVRYENMGALLHELERDRLAVVRRAGLVGTVAMLLLVTFWAARDDDVARCASGADEVPSLLDDSRHARVVEQVSVTAKGRAMELVARIDRAVDAFEGRYRESYGAACRAAFGQNVISHAQLDARLSCLARRREQLTVVLEQATRVTAPDELNRIPTALVELSHVRHCERAEPLMTSFGKGSHTPGSGSLEQELDRAEALTLTADNELALTMVRSVVLQASDPERPHLLARALLHEGILLDRMGEFEAAKAPLARAADLASREGSLDVALRAEIKLLWVMGYRLLEEEYALSRADALSRLTRLKQLDPEVRATFARTVGMLAVNADRESQARALLLESLEFYQGVGDDLMTADVFNRLGILSAQNRDHLEDAMGFYRQAIAIYEAKVGPTHPSTASVQNNLARVQGLQGRYREAARNYRAALDATEQSLGPEHVHVASIAYNLGEALNFLKQFGRALKYLRKARHIFAQAFGETHAHVLKTDGMIAWTRMDQGNETECLKVARAVIRQLDQGAPPDTAVRIDTLFVAARCASAQGLVDESRGFAERALDVMAKNDARVPLMRAIVAGADHSATINDTPNVEPTR